MLGGTELNGVIVVVSFICAMHPSTLKGRRWVFSGKGGYNWAPIPTHNVMTRPEIKPTKPPCWNTLILFSVKSAMSTFSLCDSGLETMAVLVAWCKKQKKFLQWSSHSGRRCRANKGPREGQWSYQIWTKLPVEEVIHSMSLQSVISRGCFRYSGFKPQAGRLLQLHKKCTLCIE